MNKQSYAYAVARTCRLDFEKDGRVGDDDDEAGEGEARRQHCGHECLPLALQDGAGERLGLVAELAPGLGKGKVHTAEHEDPGHGDHENYGHLEKKKEGALMISVTAEFWFSFIFLVNQNKDVNERLDTTRLKTPCSQL